MNETELKPCPFCGGKAEIITCHVSVDIAKRIKCTGCKVYTPPILIDHPAYSSREFAEKLKEHSCSLTEYDEGGWSDTVSAIKVKDIDRLVEGMACNDG